VKRISAIAASAGAIALTGCANSAISLRAGDAQAGAPAAGASYSSAAIRVEGSPNAYFGALFLGYVAVGLHDTYSRAGSPVSREPPQLAADRAIAERDCSKPMETPSANLRCK
jgi:hypothetical protein